MLGSHVIGESLELDVNLDQDHGIFVIEASKYQEEVIRGVIKHHKSEDIPKIPDKTAVTTEHGTADIERSITNLSADTAVVKTAVMTEHGTADIPEILATVLHMRDSVQVRARSKQK